MSYALLSESRPKARKDHICIWCGQSIPKGTVYYAERSVFDGEMQNHHWHLECIEFAHVYFTGESEWEFEPCGNDRPHDSSSASGREKGRLG